MSLPDSRNRHACGSNPPDAACLAPTSAAVPTSAAASACVAYIALGANLNQPEVTLHAAIRALSMIPGTRLMAVSSLYRTAPVGLKHQPDFINAVASLDIQESHHTPPEELLARLFAIEAHFGRQRSIPNAPRTLDLDLLLYNEQVIQTPTLTLPHPRMHQRAFVLAPLLEIAPDCQIPGLGSAAALFENCRDQSITRLSPEV